MELLKQYEEVKKIQEEKRTKEEELQIKEDISFIVKDILSGKEETGAVCKKTLEVLNISKFKDSFMYSIAPSYYHCYKYEFKITKKIIEKVENYLEEN